MVNEIEDSKKNNQWIISLFVALIVSAASLLFNFFLWSYQWDIEKQDTLETRKIELLESVSYSGSKINNLYPFKCQIMIDQFKELGQLYGYISLDSIDFDKRSIVLKKLRDKFGYEYEKNLECDAYRSDLVSNLNLARVYYSDSLNKYIDNYLDHLNLKKVYNLLFEKMKKDKLKNFMEINTLSIVDQHAKQSDSLFSDILTVMYNEIINDRDR
ncbi:MAG: hypothetical protein GY839_04825 [candidate division Zixibacteria bacterium]|nr:hypothetical protein [candidate division Zixibacteria bacterium]